MCKFQLIAVFLGVIFLSCEDNSSSPPLPVPQINFFEPPGAIAGSEVTITGSDLENVVSVTVGGTEATIKSISEGLIVFVVPDGASSGKIEMSTEDNATTSANDFFVGGYWRLTNAPANLGAYSTAHFQIGDDFYYGLGYKTCPGCSNSDSKALIKFDPVQEEWYGQSPFPSSGVAGTFYFTIDDKAYVGGGHGSKSLALYPEMYEFDHSTGSWAEISEIPALAYGWTGLSFNGKGYIFKDKMFEFDPQAKTWTEKNPFPDIPQQSSFVVGGKEYLLMRGGGLWEFDPVTSGWTEKRRFPVDTMENMFAFMLKDRIYVGSEQDFFSYSPTHDSWSPLQPYPGQFSQNVVGFGIGDRGYAGLPEILADPVVNELYAFELQ